LPCLPRSDISNGI